MVGAYPDPYRHSRCGHVTSCPHSRCGHATGSNGVYPSPTRGKEARRIQVSERRKRGGTLAHSVCCATLVVIESSLCPRPYAHGPSDRGHGVSGSIELAIQLRQVISAA